MALTQGDGASESVPLPSGWCSPNEYLRAFICAEAVLRPKNSDIKAFLTGIQREFSFIEFGDILVSVDLNPDYGFKFLVADADDAIFIAFQVSQNFNDSLGSALCKLPSGGQVDSAVFALSHDFLGNDMETLTEHCLFRQGKRIIFCGHEFGGALAHMVVLQFYNSRDKVRKDLSQMISIAFGSPYICSKTYAEEVNGNNELKSHFFDVVHEHDPRCSIRRATTQVKRADKSVKTCLEPKFFPIGETLVLKGSNTSTSHFRPQFTSNSWSRDTVFNSYKDALAELAQPTSASKPSDPNQSKLVLRVITPTPEIKSAELKGMHSGMFVHVKGSNLKFLREPVKMNGLNPWKCTIQKDDELYLFEPPQTDARREGNDMALIFIDLKTAFGEASHLISENNVSGGPPTGVRGLLFKVVQTFVALASGPVRISQRSELLDDLASIVQCVPDLKDVSKVLREIANSEADNDLVQNIENMNSTVEKVVEFLTRSCIIDYPVSVPVILGMVSAGLLTLGALAIIPVAGVALVTSGCLTGAGVASSAVAYYLNNKQLLIPDYRTMLNIAIQEAQLWHEEGPTPELPDKTEVELESLLAEEVERSGSHLTKMMENIHKPGAKAKDIVFCSKAFDGAALESKANLLRRMQIVTKTFRLYKKKVQGIRFVGVVGAEDAGKSTFIRKAILHSGGKPDSELPDVGFDCHTKTVRAYKLGTKGNLYLVDFPGSNGTGTYADAWKQFTSLPSSCVLLLDFKDDIKQDQVEMYQSMKRDLNSKVTVVVNKVDEKFTPRKEADYDAQYFDQQRASTAKMLQCNKNDVQFACLYPDPEEKLIKLKKVGVLDFEELFHLIGSSHSLGLSHS